jgi:hypothetical protein
VFFVLKKELPSLNNHIKKTQKMKAIIKINLMNLQGTMHKVVKVQDNLYYINVPFLNDFITLTFLPSQVEIFN